ncbi:hypothetical protein [Thermosyntropha sp.]|uniref:hypothetical protein n=1 Tax=Thermosyntropha sp. TaxID=2740820 RepID=UPI0025DFC0F5|nr:hypothetical protein [Thermosyntropha sp.]MBO8158834.1 hypothetical protein [Thermosyntropha sp.]
MVKVRILTSVAGLTFSFQAGQVIEIDEPLAAELVRAGHAVRVKEEKTATIDVPEKAVTRHRKVK